MKLKDILSISGKSGLFKFISQGRNGIIVESFEDKKKTLAHSSVKVSALEDIAIFTETEEMPLANVFKIIYDKENGKATISHKSSPEELKTYFEKILPEYDRSRVYVSDIKKVVNWYNLLIDLNLLDPTSYEYKKEDEKKEAKADGNEKTINIKETLAKSEKKKTSGVKKAKKD
jgi:hypothetical protein